MAEAERKLPAAGSAAPPVDPVAKAQAAAADAAVKDAKASLGGAVTVSRETAELPELQEVELDSYVVNDGVITATRIRGVVVDGYRFGRAAGYDFMLMRIAAAMDGIDLEPVSAYRTMEQQQGLYNERFVIPWQQISYRDHYAGKNRKSASGIKNGQAAYPGASNHQSGSAIDINVGLTIAEFASGRGRKNEKYLWLERNGAAFGFDNKEAPNEPWHWRHKSDTIVGKIEGLTVKGLTKAEIASLASSTSVPGARKFDILAAQREINASDRRDAANTARSTLLAMAVGGHLRRASDKKAAAALAGLRANSASLASASGSTGTSTPGETAAPAGPLPPRGMASGAELQAFNFETGLWGDGRIV